jgi:Bacterial protein of unknown function (DUF937)
MGNLYDILAAAEGGEAMAMLGREFGLTPQQTQAAVMALLPAISTGLKQATATPEGLGSLFGVMGQQRDLHAMYGAPDVAFAQAGRAAGNDVLSVIFGSPDVSRAVVDQAQQFSGVGSSILKKMLPVIVGMIVSGLMGGRSGQAAPKGSPASPTGGGLGDILGQIFGRGAPGSPPSQLPQFPSPGGQPTPTPTDAGGQGDLLGHILRELEKGIREGRIKPVIIDGGQMPMPGGQGGPMQFPMPGGQREPTPMPDRQQPPAPSDQQAPGGDILGQILRDLLGGAGGPTRAPQQRGPSPGMKDLSDLSKQLGITGGVGSAVFGDQFEVGRDVEQEHLQRIQSVFDRFFTTQRG